MTINRLLSYLTPNSITYQSLSELDVRKIPLLIGPDDAIRGHIMEYHARMWLVRSGATIDTDIPRTLASGLELRMSSKGPCLYNNKNKPLSEYDGLFSFKEKGYREISLATQVKASGIDRIRKQIEREVKHGYLRQVYPAYDPNLIVFLKRRNRQIKEAADTLGTSFPFVNFVYMNHSSEMLDQKVEEFKDINKIAKVKRKKSSKRRRNGNSRFRSC